LGQRPAREDVGKQANNQVERAEPDRSCGFQGSWAEGEETVVKNPFQFIVEVRQETSKVTWPTWKEVWITTTMVLIMVAMTSVFFLLTDMVISHLVQFVLRLGR
jgi:preprotein translocase subunit SecE